MSHDPIEPPVRDAWYIAAWSHEVADAPLARRLLGEDVVLFRDASGRTAILEDRCCHRAAPLSLGSVVGDGIQCGYHGMIFGGDGACIGNPGEEDDRALYRVRAFPVVERQGFVWVWMGDPDLADRSAIIDYPFHEAGEEWPFQFGHYRYDANFMFVVDNLMDLTHLGYVHGSTIGGFPQSHVDAELETAATENGARYIRWMMASPPPPSFVAAGGFEGPVDRWSEFEYVAPASVLQWGGALDVGRGARENRNQDGGVSLRLFHHATPESETSCHYFWSVANRNCSADTPAGKRLYQDIADAFIEDKIMIEAQQAAILRDRERGLHYRRHDEAVALARRALRRMSVAGPRAAAAE